MSVLNARRILQVHRWTGLVLGLLLAWLALTGAGMLFAPQLRSLVDHDLALVPRCPVSLPLDVLLDRARRAHVDGTVRLIGIRREQTASVLVRFLNGDTVYLDPCTGRVLGERNKNAGLFGSLEYLHRLKALPIGGSIVGTAALTFALVMVVGGLISGWPASIRAVRRSLTFAPGLRGRARLMNQHRAVGFWISLALLTSALTGPLDSFAWYRRAMYELTQSPAPEPEPTARATDGPRLSMQALWQRALSITPDPTEALISVPKPGTNAVKFDLLESGAPHAEARSLLYLEAHSGIVLSFRPYASSSPGNKVVAWGLAIHKGEVGPLAQVLLLMGALGVPVLAYTGISSYLRRLSGPATRPA
jgi:vanillate O-demethylase ferredoxin subunit